MSVRGLLFAGTSAALLYVAASHAADRSIVMVRTNYVDRWITNRVEVTMPRNLIMDVFHTNHIVHYYTNVIDVLRTNRVAAYRTNQVDVFVTNTVPVNVTNLAQTWVTNTKTFWLTNLTTVVAFKTNLLSLVATNVVELDVPVSTPASVPEPPQPAVERGQQVAGGPVKIEVAAAPARLSGLLGVELKASAQAGAPEFTVVSWSVQSENGAMMFAGKDPEFKRELPAGRYTVEVITISKEKQIKTKGALVVGERQASIVSQPLALLRH